MSVAKNLIISIDPGYDAYKICINDVWFKFSSKMLQVAAGSYGNTDEKNDMTGGHRPKGSTYILIDGKEFLFGDVADLSMDNTSLVQQNSDILDQLSEKGKFASDYFNYSIKAALAYALYLYENSPENTDKFQISKIGNYQVFLGVALPHTMMSATNKDKVKSFLLCKHNFTLKIEELETIEISYDLSDAKLAFGSQVVSAYLFQTTDDDGIDDNKEDYLPCIVCDGGYKTFGRFFLDRGLIMQHGDSDTTVAMYNTDLAVTAWVKQQLPNRNFQPYQVKEYVKTKHPITSGKEKVDVYSRWCEEVKINSNKAYRNIISTMKENVDDSRAIFITGGTGIAYYDTFVKSFEKDYGDNIQVILTNKDYKGKTVDPVFAIVLGMQKHLNSLIASL